MRLCYVCTCVLFLILNVNSYVQHDGLAYLTWSIASLSGTSSTPHSHPGPRFNPCQNSYFRELCYDFYMEEDNEDGHLLFFFSSFCYNFGIVGFTLHSSLLFSTILNPQAGSDLQKSPSLCLENDPCSSKMF